MVDQVPSEYYIDESGNTGDLSTVKADASASPLYNFHDSNRHRNR